MTRANFQERMKKLGGLRYQPTTLDGHWELVLDRPDAQIDAAILASLKQSVFPTPKEFMDYTVAAQLAARESLPIGCAQCDYSGWETRVIDGEEWVKRCVCWKAHQLRAHPVATGDVGAVVVARSKLADISARKRM